jgi:hypothetical protein
MRTARAVPVQEHHDLAHHLLLRPGGRDAAGSYWTNAIYLLEAVRFRLNDIEHPVAEGAQKLLGIDRTNAADHSGGEVFLDAFVRCRGRGFEESGLELLSVGAVVDPVAGCRNPLSGRDGGGMTNQGDQITVPAGLNPDDTKAVVGVLISDALNQSSQYLAIGWCGFHIHNIRHTRGRPFSKSGLSEKTC